MKFTVLRAATFGGLLYIKRVKIGVVCYASRKKMAVAQECLLYREVRYIVHGPDRVSNEHHLGCPLLVNLQERNTIHSFAPERTEMLMPNS